LRHIPKNIILDTHMTDVIKLRKGLDISLKGKATEKILPVVDTGVYALVPDDFTGIVPKLAVKEQDTVVAGGALLYDKNHPELKIVSPVGGVVTAIIRGARRKIMNVVVKASTEQEYKEFGKQDVSKLDADSAKALLLESGLMAFVRQRPYDVVADPSVAPAAIFVSAFDSSPLAPDFEFVL
jgi:Na+-transporting NADH:ubiquinone oxidoreductase subunit A